MKTTEVQTDIALELREDATPDGVIELRCGDVSMFQGRMGRKGGHIAVRIDRELPKQEIMRQ